MAVMPLVPETKIADVSKLISLGSLLVKKISWLVLTTTSSDLILARGFGTHCTTSISHIYSRLPSSHTLTFFAYKGNTFSLSLLHFDFQQSTRRKCIHSETLFFFSCSTFTVRLA